MTSRLHFLVMSMAYCLLLSWIYFDEIVPLWSYMGFNGTFSLTGLSGSLIFVTLIGFFCPITKETRSILLICLSFTAFIPSVIYISYAPDILYSYTNYAICIFMLFSLSGVKLNSPFFSTSNTTLYMYAMAFFAVLAIIAQAAFGGMDDFNLDIDKVYDFRREASDKLPPIFAYLYSNVSTTLIPILIVFSIVRRNYALLLISFIIAILLFGMSHHKGVIFGPVFIALFYLLLSRPILRKYMLYIFLLIPIISLLEISYTRNFIGIEEPSYLTSLIVRRVLFVPSMLDLTYIEFFSANPKYYWSGSSLLSWALQNPYGITAPHLIGFDHFADLDTSANTGIVGSGYSNAGIFGVFIYSASTGILIALLNSYGNKIDAAVVSAISLTSVFNIVTSTDFLTSFLTHGLLLLIFSLAFCPRDLLLTR
jgi:hypothetical protein